MHALPYDITTEGAGSGLHRELADRGIAVTSVVNNAGAGMWGPFREADPDRLQQMIRLNIAAVVDISRAFLDQIVETGGGYLLNLTSVAAYSSIPNQGAYSASKAFVLSFTEALWAEAARGTDTRVLAFAPGVTDTEFFDVVGTRDADGGSEYQSPAQVAEAALAVLDRRDPPPSAVSGWRNHLLTVPMRFVTRRTAVTLTGRVTLATTSRDRSDRQISA